MPCTPDFFLKAITPYREDMAVAVECIFTWYWLADHGGMFSRANNPVMNKMGDGVKPELVAALIAVFRNRYDPRQSFLVSQIRPVD